MTVCIVGAGALGTLVGASLARTCDVRVVTRDAQGAMEIARRGGLQLGGDPARQVFVTHDGTAALRGADVVLVAVKTFATHAALSPLRESLHPQTPIVSLQNGIDAVALIEAAIGERGALALAPTTEAATALAPGYARRAGDGSTRLGWAQGRSGDEDILPALVRHFIAGGLAAERVQPIEPELWAKLLVNAAINPLTACAGVTNGALLDSPELRGRLRLVVREVAAVAAAGGIVLPFGDPVDFVEAVARKTAANRSSMLQDLERGRPTEIDAIAGAVVRRAHALGVAVPENRRLYDEVRRRTNA